MLGRFEICNFALYFGFNHRFVVRIYFVRVCLRGTIDTKIDARGSVDRIFSLLVLRFEKCLNDS